ncbi:MAG: ATP-binding protein, partial [Deltaproteobacteria bacterium]|nr:ATP-binding protein [Deltaproteobacteria bacterium]
KKILDMYDGYTWDGLTKVLNPFSVLNFFRNYKFNAFWMNQDPSAKLISALVAKDPLSFTEEKLRELTVKQVGVAEVGSLAPVAALFQTGYLTVAKVSSLTGSELYNFKIPNEEIRPEFNSIFSKGLYSVLKKEPRLEKRSFKSAVLLGETEKITVMFCSLFASLPSRHHRPEESFYHSVLFGYFYNMPDTVITLAEQPGAVGIPDMVLIFDDGLYVVMELKYKKEADTDLTEDELKTTLIDLAENGLKAIESKHYLWPYLDRAKKIVKMGVGIYGRDQALVFIKN